MDSLFLFNSPIMFEANIEKSVYINALDNYKIYDSNNKVLGTDGVKQFQLFGSWIYYIPKYEDCLYRISLDGKVKECIDISHKNYYSGIKVLSFSVDDSGIYYLASSNSCRDKYIYKLDFNSEIKSKTYINNSKFDRRNISRRDSPIVDRFILAIDGKVFLLTDKTDRYGNTVNGFKPESIYYIDSNGEFIFVQDNVTTLYPRSFEGYIFYTIKAGKDRAKLYKLKVEGEVNKGKSVFICHVNEEWFNVGDSLWVLPPKYNSSYCIHNGVIYYSNADDKGKLSKITTNGTEKQRLSNETLVKGIKIFGDWIYYRGYNGEYLPYNNDPKCFTFKKYDENYHKQISNRIKVDGSNKEYLGHYGYNKNGVNLKVLVNEDYKYIKNNFKVEKASKGCYLTTACVEFRGLDDKCEELTILRGFRDTYMNLNMPSEIEEYYNIAPKIIKRINNLNEYRQKECYDYIYSVIKKCCELIKENKNEYAYNEYKLMIKVLSEI